MGFIELWKWCRENKTENKKLDVSCPDHTCLPKLESIEPTISKAKHDAVVQKLERLEERVQFLWDGSMESRQIKLEIEFSKIQDNMTFVIKQTVEQNKKINDLIMNNNDLIPKVKDILLQFGSIAGDLYVLNKQFDELVEVLTEEELIGVIGDTKTTTH